MFLSVNISVIVIKIVMTRGSFFSFPILLKRVAVLYIFANKNFIFYIYYPLGVKVEECAVSGNEVSTIDLELMELK